MLRKTSLLAAATALVALTVAAPAGAAKKASASQLKVLTRAVQASPVGDLEDVPTNQYRVTDMKISSKSRNWSSARLVARPGFENTFQSSTVMAVQPGGTSFWIVVDVGTAEVGCGIAPNSVVKDLTSACPPGDGVS